MQGRPPINRFSVRPPQTVVQAVPPQASFTTGMPAQSTVSFSAQSSASLAMSAAPAEKAPLKVFMDAQGRMVDEQGNIINMRQ